MPRPSVRTETFREWVRVAKVPLPLAAPGTIGRIGPVYDVAYTGTIANTNAYRTP